MPSKHRKRRHRRRRNSLGVKILLLVLVVVLVAAFVAMQQWEKSRYKQQRGVTSEDFYEDNEITFDGVEYKTKRELTSILFMGVEKAGTKDEFVDMAMLLLLDHKDNVVRWLQFDPNTLLEGGVRLTEATRVEGDAKARSTAAMETVAGLLDVQVELFVTLDMERVGVFNDAVGGIRLEIDEDYSQFDPAMKKGATITLSADQAQTYWLRAIRSDERTNEERMRSEQAFMLAALESLKQRAEENSDVLTEFYEALGDVMTTNIRPTRMLNEVSKSYGYEIQDAVLLPGTSRTEGAKTIFELDNNKLREWVVSAFYRLKEE